MTSSQLIHVDIIYIRPSFDVLDLSIESVVVVGKISLHLLVILPRVRAVNVHVRHHVVGYMT